MSCPPRSDSYHLNLSSSILKDRPPPKKPSPEPAHPSSNPGQPLSDPIPIRIPGFGSQGRRIEIVTNDGSYFWENGTTMEAPSSRILQWIRDRNMQPVVNFSSNIVRILTNYVNLGRFPEHSNDHRTEGLMAAATYFGADQLIQELDRLVAHTPPGNELNGQPLGDIISFLDRDGQVVPFRICPLRAPSTYLDMISRSWIRRVRTDFDSETLRAVFHFVRNGRFENPADNYLPMMFRAANTFQIPILIERFRVLGTPPPEQEPPRAGQSSANQPQAHPGPEGARPQAVGNVIQPEEVQEVSRRGRFVAQPGNVGPRPDSPEVEIIGIVDPNRPSTPPVVHDVTDSEDEEEGGEN